MLLKTLFVQPLGPAVILIMGGLLLALGRRLARPGALWADAMSATRPDRADELKVWLHLLRAPFALLILGLATLALFHLRGRDPQPTLAWMWQPLTVSGSTITWQLDAWNWFAALLILAVTAVSVLLEWDEGAADDVARRVDLLGSSTERTLWLAAAALIFTAAGNILTLATSWLILDAALAFRLQSVRSAQPVARAWGLLSLFGVLLLLVLAVLGENGIRTSLLSGQLRGLPLTVLWVAALVRAGVYPLHFWLTGGGERDRQAWTPVTLLVGTAGLWLLARVQALGGADWVRRPEWIALGALALVGSALVAWTVADASQRWRWLALNRAGVAVIAATMAPAARPELLAWPLVAFALGSALLAAAQAARTRLRWRWPALAAALVLWGLPGTAGFLARASLVYPTGLSVATPLFAVMALADMLFVAGLVQACTGDAAPARARPRWTMVARVGLALVIVAVPLVAWGLFPTQLARLAGFAPAEVFGSLRDLLPVTRRSVWFGLAVSAAGGVALGLFRERIFGQMRGWQRGIAEIAGLEWLYRAAGAGFMLVANGLRYFATLGEGEGYLGWLALAGFLLWVLLRA